MKAVSLSLKIIALLAAAFCVYAWIDTRGKISTAETHMKGVPGETLVEKAPKVPGLLKTIAENKEKIAALQSSLRSSEQRNQDVNSELESERVKSVQANAEIVKKNAEIRSLNANVASSKKRIAEKDSLIESLKKEIVSTKALLSQTNEADALKDKVATLESQLGVKSKALEEAEAKIKTLESSEVVEVVETDASGKKIVKKVVKVPYEPKGDIATVISASPKDAIVVINKGEADGVKASQKIALKREGTFVSEIVIVETRQNEALGYINPNRGIPETIEAGDLLELAAVAEKSAEENSAEKPAAAPAEKAEDADNQA